MKVNLAKYANKKICVAVSGGKDSMALLHYIYLNGKEFNITLTALNCDHGIRGETSAKDSAFVKDWCVAHNIPLLFFKACGFEKNNEVVARLWRIKCYTVASSSNILEVRDSLLNGTEIAVYPNDYVWCGADAIATAHHLSDNAETVLFNLARGSGLNGMTGIEDFSIEMSGVKLNEIRPLIECSRNEIDDYINENNIPFVTDETNLTNDYTRNKIRHNVLPELENAVPGATKAIYRFSRLAAEDEEYFSRQVESILSDTYGYGYKIKFCQERVIFKRAVIKIFVVYNLKDYTSDMLERLYNLQFADVGKRFEFLGLTAFKEDGKIVVLSNDQIDEQENGAKYKYFTQSAYRDNYCGEYVTITTDEYFKEDMDELKKLQSNEELVLQGILPNNIKTLRFDFDKVPIESTVRFMRQGDKFKKFGGGTKKLGDYFTDKKIPMRLRNRIPLIISPTGEVLIVCGVEISDMVKVTESTKNVGYVIANDYKKI